MDIVNWCDEELLSKLKEDRDPCDAPPSIYTPQPNQCGKIIWISGILITTYIQIPNCKITILLLVYYLLYLM